MRFLKVILSLVFFLLFDKGFTQDLSFSQYFHLNNYINPAATGNTPEDLTVTLAYRNQWSSVSDAFSSSLVSVEYTPGKKKKNRSYLSLGLLGVSQKAGVSQFKSSIYRGIGAFHFQLAKEKKLSFGLEIGYNQRSFDLDGLAWDSQFNGAGHDPSLPTMETFSNTSNSFLDTGFGVEFRNENIRRFFWKAGLGVHHYYQDQTVLENGNDPLASLSQLYFQSQQTNGYFMFRYYCMVQAQDLAAISGTVGADITYRVNYDSKYTNFSSSSAITAGLFYRYRDAIIALVGYEFKRQFRLGVSYDINVSTLRPASNLNGGPEINLTYLLQSQRKRRRVR